jgi:hypothetical protein
MASITQANVASGSNSAGAVNNVSGIAVSCKNLQEFLHIGADDKIKRRGSDEVSQTDEVDSFWML